MKIGLFAIILLTTIASCKKEYSFEAPALQHKCGFLTDKYLSNGTTPTFNINGELPPLGFGELIEVSQTEFDNHKIGEWYCY